MRKELISVIIPAYNEEKNIGKVLQKLLTLSKTYNIEIIVVDDGSTDNTTIVSRGYEIRRVIQNKKNRGKGSAFIEGAKKAKGAFIIQIDADDQFQVKDIPQFIKKLNDGYDVVCGTRFRKGTIEKGSVNFINNIGNFLISKATVFFSGIDVTDIMAGFKGFRKKALKELKLSTNHFGYEAEVIVKAGKLGMNVAEVPITYKKRVYGKSSVNTLKDGFKVIFTIAKMYLTFPGPPFGKGVVGRRIISIATPTMLFVILPYFSYVSTLRQFGIPGFITHLALSIIFLVSILYYTKSKLAAFLSSSLIAISSTISIQNPTINILFVKTYGSIYHLFLAISILTFISFFIKNTTKSPFYEIVKLVMLEVIVLFITQLFLPFFINNHELIFITTFIFIQYNGFVLFNSTEPKVSFLQIISIILLLFYMATKNIYFGNIGFAIGIAGLFTNLTLASLSFKIYKTPLFSKERIFRITIIAIIIVAIFAAKLNNIEL